jgi:hypothetical protein
MLRSGKIDIRYKAEILHWQNSAAMRKEQIILVEDDDCDSERESEGLRQVGIRVG